MEMEKKQTLQDFFKSG